MKWKINQNNGIFQNFDSSRIVRDIVWKHKKKYKHCTHSITWMSKIQMHVQLYTTQDIPTACHIDDVKLFFILEKYFITQNLKNNWDFFWDIFLSFCILSLALATRNSQQSLSTTIAPSKTKTTGIYRAGEREGEKSLPPQTKKKQKSYGENMCGWHGNVHFSTIANFFIWF